MLPGMSMDLRNNDSSSSAANIENKTEMTGILLTTSLPEIVNSLLKNVTSGTSANTTTTTTVRTTMTTITASTTDAPLPSSAFEKMNEMDKESVAFVLIPLFLIIGVAIVSGIGFLWITKRRKLDRLRHRLIPTYTFSPGEEDEWGVLINHSDDDK